jgi:hypothetical protein
MVRAEVLIPVHVLDGDLIALQRARSGGPTAHPIKLEHCTKHFLGSRFTSTVIGLVNTLDEQVKKSSRMYECEVACMRRND